MFIKGATLAITMSLGILIGFAVGSAKTDAPIERTVYSAYIPPPSISTASVDNSELQAIETKSIVSNSAQVTTNAASPPPTPEEKPHIRTTDPRAIIDIPDKQFRVQNIVYLRDHYRLSHKETVSQVNDVVLQLAMNAFFECRGEGKSCMAAVTHVTINRLNDDRFPRTVKGVLVAPGQYSWKPAQARITRTLTSIEKTEVWADAVNTVYDVLRGKITDPTRGSLYFCNPRASTVKFCQNLNRRKKAKIGNHVFG